MSVARRIADQRRFERTETSLNGSLIAGDQALPCVVLDVSTGGARVEIDRSVERAGAVDLTIGAFDPIAGDVAWCREHTLGIRFTDSTDKIAATLIAIVVYG